MDFKLDQMLRIIAVAGIFVVMTSCDRVPTNGVVGDRLTAQTQIYQRSGGVHGRMRKKMV